MEPKDKPLAMAREDEQAYVQREAREEPPPAAPSPASDRPPGPSSPAPAPAPAAPASSSGSRVIRPPTDHRRAWSAGLSLFSACCVLGALALFFWPTLQGGGGKVTPVAAPVAVTYAPGEFSHAKAIGGDQQAEDGETVGTFEGFAVMVESQPGGAHVLVNGDDRGEAPVAAGVECQPGTVVNIEVRKRSYQTYHHATHCRANTMVKINPVLKKESGSPHP